MSLIMITLLYEIEMINNVGIINKNMSVKKYTLPLYMASDNIPILENEEMDIIDPDCKKDIISLARASDKIPIFRTDEKADQESNNKKKLIK